MSKKLVLMDHDGAVDDYLSVVLLMTMQEVETLGVIVTPADCYIQPAVSATRKILDLMGCSEVPVAASTVRGLNPFPVLFRRDSFACDRLPILNEKATIDTPLISEPGQNFMVRVLRGFEFFIGLEKFGIEKSAKPCEKQILRLLSLLLQ